MVLLLKRLCLGIAEQRFLPHSCHKATFTILSFSRDLLLQKLSCCGLLSQPLVEHQGVTRKLCCIDAPHLLTRKRLHQNNSLADPFTKCFSYWCHSNTSVCNCFPPKSLAEEAEDDGVVVHNIWNVSLWGKSALAEELWLKFCKSQS